MQPRFGIGKSASLVPAPGGARPPEVALSRGLNAFRESLSLSMFCCWVKDWDRGLCAWKEQKPADACAAHFEKKDDGKRRDNRPGCLHSCSGLAPAPAPLKHHSLHFREGIGQWRSTPLQLHCWAEFKQSIQAKRRRRDKLRTDRAHCNIGTCRPPGDAALPEGEHRAQLAAQ